MPEAVLGRAPERLAIAHSVRRQKRSSSRSLQPARAGSESQAQAAFNIWGRGPGVSALARARLEGCRGATQRAWFRVRALNKSSSTNTVLLQPI